MSADVTPSTEKDARPRWWRSLRHDRRDINCIRWNQPATAHVTCRRCLRHGGYVETIHARATSPGGGA